MLPKPKTCHNPAGDHNTDYLYILVIKLILSIPKTSHHHTGDHKSDYHGNGDYKADRLSSD